MILEVIVDISSAEVDRTFDYLGDDIPLGSRVSVEFGKKRLLGFVVGKKETSTFANLKKATLIDSPIDEKQLKLMDYMRSKYNLRYIDVLRLFLPTKLREEKNPEYTRIYLSPNSKYSCDEAKALIGTRAKKQIELYDHLSEKGGGFLSQMVNLYGASAVNGLREKGVVTESDVHERRVPLGGLDRKDKVVTLTDAQQSAVDQIVGGEGVYLLHGVTGSGKTEIYLHVIEHFLSKGKTSIMLVPEISLTPQMLGIFRARFGDKVAILHSGLNASERYDEWKRLRTGQAQIAIGARSAIFAPLENLGAIFIDEEHDTSYLSESNPRYDTRDVAEERARIAGAVLVLGSATPDICTYQKAADGKFNLITLPDRISAHKLPDMEIIDMTYEFRSGNRSPFSHELIDVIGQAIERKEQVILFLNRRGFASFMRCRDCGYIPKCDLCDVSMTYHKHENSLKCHYCGTTKAPMTVCPECGSHNVKEGRVGTEKIVEELQSIFPDVKCLRMDNDTTSGKDAYFKILDKFSKGEADILVGTQMIAKGHDFPNVTLVGIIEADAALFMSDYRASERTFQLVTQVAGRAGRAEKKGRVILQAFWPSHYVFKFAKTYDYAGFFGVENNRRLVTGFPPYKDLVRVMITSSEVEDGRNSAKAIYLAVRELQRTYGKFPFLNLTASPLKKLSGQFRYQIVMRLETVNSQMILNDTYKIVGENRPKKGTAFVEINPQNLY